ncbi:hypothetical protein FJR48_00465 [Sulfurimonas lithotrophica]|uniref:Cytochrome oxidase subunit I profile domain-containing protein n=1 Tax=Sulfurimonas lithotrophica TaxID=2590022 RepID=A0A5P8NXZ1_9BACT|nr:hypothetical protein [Sulfurimonas lithotrophica]QFR48276.1 hypothetical protein FJR48_00465 [Sulfurimonas lithotrophica]
MENFNTLIQKTLPTWTWIFFISILVGAIYAAQLLGFSLFSNTLLNPVTTRSLHITLMLYGPIMLALSLLPFALFAKDNLNLSDAAKYLKNYFFLWHLFLFMAGISILLGAQRGLAFYDFAYELNFILASSGIFYIIAIFKTIKQYKVQPVWVKVSKTVLFSAPIALIILMNPVIGQVESTITGPHGDNTLGMSFTLIPLFYLMIKLYAKEEIKPRLNILWIIPLVGYIASVSHRIFIGELSYSQEWFFQWLTFFYAPVLYIWYKDAKLSLKSHPYLIISIWAFLFVMIQGNILFIPEIRWPFHRNDLVVAHAHVAIGLGIFFMSLSILSYFYKLPKKLIHAWSYVIALIFFPLTISGFVQAGFLDANIEIFWWLRLLGGLLALGVILYYIYKALCIKKPSLLELYHLNGFASDGLGAIILILFAPQLFDFLGFNFSPHYYLVFGFMGFVGLLHLIGISKHSHFLAEMTSYARVITGTMFFSLFYVSSLDALALLVGFYDISYALIYLLWIRNR